jgi:nitric oxide reductase activation protein
MPPIAPHNGSGCEHGLYRQRARQERDFACLLLADLSLSTDAWVNNKGRVIDVIRDSLFLFAEALAANRRPLWAVRLFFMPAATGAGAAD